LFKKGWENHLVSGFRLLFLEQGDLSIDGPEPDLQLLPGQLKHLDLIFCLNIAAAFFMAAATVLHM
jgi:hypothetical protein